MPDRDHPSHSASQRELGGSVILMGLTSGVREHILVNGYNQLGVDSTLACALTVWGLSAP